MRHCILSIKSTRPFIGFVRQRVVVKKKSGRINTRLRKAASVLMHVNKKIPCWGILIACAHLPVPTLKTIIGVALMTHSWGVCMTAKDATKKRYIKTPSGKASALPVLVEAPLSVESFDK